MLQEPENPIPGQPEPRRLLRDREGHVHAPSGYMTEKRYRKMCREYPKEEFPAYETIPLMSDLTLEDLDRWYGRKQ